MRLHRSSAPTRARHAAALLGILAALLALIVGCIESNGSGGDLVSMVPNTADAGETRGALRVDADARLRTLESGGRATFTVALATKPAAKVVVPLESFAPSEVAVEPSALTFGPDDWSTPKVVTLTGQDDDVADGDVEVRVALGPAQSSDDVYNGVTADAVRVTNADDDTAGIEVSKPTPATSTTEAGGQSSFAVRLRSKPTADVTIPVTSSRPSEGLPDKPRLVFTPANWAKAQTVTVTGQNDGFADGDQPYAIHLERARTTDGVYARLAAQDVWLVNEDDDIAGFFASGPSNAGKTTEAGGVVTFTVRLRAAPTSSVTISVSSSKPGEGTPNVSELVFTPETYATLQTVTVTGQDDDFDDDDQAYSILLGNAVSADPAYVGLDAPDVALVNADDDTAGVLVGTPTSGTTTEGGGTTSFTVRLQSRPVAPVTIPVSSSRPAEGAPDVTDLVFGTGATDWSTPRTVTITGQDDFVDDDNQAYKIVLGACQTIDPKYQAIDPRDIDLVNVDDDTAGIAVGPPSGALTTEGGGEVTFTVVLQSQPTATVSLPITISKPGEATVLDALPLTFAPETWSLAQTVTVRGLDDKVDDGDQPYFVQIGPATSADARYAGRDPADIALTNVDDDVAGITVSASGTTTSEQGGAVTITIALTSQPTATVTIPVSLSDTSVAFLDRSQVVFTPLDWTSKTVLVTGMDDGAAIGDVPYTVVLGPALGGDYAGLDAPDVSLTSLSAD